MTELIVALDVPTFEDATKAVDSLADAVTWYKVGYESYFAFGQRLIPALRERGKKIFLDLKLHDIPNSVAGGIRSLATSGASLLTVHASGGRQMLTAAVAARDEVNAAGADLRLLAVTLLTSHSAEDLRAVGVAGDPRTIVSICAGLAAECGIDGCVCAVDEAAIVRSRVSAGFLIVCPGIRGSGQPIDDQRRIATPTDAVLAGAVAIVVGRPVTKAPDPKAAAQAILDEIKAALPIYDSGLA